MKRDLGLLQPQENSQIFRESFLWMIWSQLLCEEREEHSPDNAIIGGTTRSGLGIVFKWDPVNIVLSNSGKEGTMKAMR